MEKVFENILENFQKQSIENTRTIRKDYAIPVIIAELKRWDNTIEKQIIQRNWIDDMVFAVESQMLVQNKETGLRINGAKYRHIDVYEIE